MSIEQSGIVPRDSLSKMSMLANIFYHSKGNNTSAPNNQATDTSTVLLNNVTTVPSTTAPSTTVPLTTVPTTTVPSTTVPPTTVPSKTNVYFISADSFTLSEIIFKGNYNGKKIRLINSDETWSSLLKGDEGSLAQVVKFMKCQNNR